MAFQTFPIGSDPRNEPSIEIRCVECGEHAEFFHDQEDELQGWESAHKCDVCLICGYADGIAGTENLIHEDCYNDNRPLGHALIVAHQSALEAAMWAEIDAAVAK